MLRPDGFVVDATETARKEGWRPKGVAEWHGDVFSRHGSLLVVYVLWRSTNEVNVLRPDEIRRRCNGNSKEGGVTAEG